MFTPTHLLVSRSRQTPVQLVAGPKGYHLYTEKEWQQGHEPAFELRPKLGVYCKGLSVVGYHLQPLMAEVTTEDPTAIANTNA